MMKVKIDNDNMFICNHCDDELTHHSDPMIYENVNNSSGSIPLIRHANGKKSIDVNIKMPYKGDSVVIPIWCETCGETSFLYISQHKGRTHITTEKQPLCKFPPYPELAL